MTNTMSSQTIANRQGMVSKGRAVTSINLRGILVRTMASELALHRTYVLERQHCSGDLQGCMPATQSDLQQHTARLQTRPRFVTSRKVNVDRRDVSNALLIGAKGKGSFYRPNSIQGYGCACVSGTSMVLAVQGCCTPRVLATEVPSNAGPPPARLLPSLF